MKITRNQLRRIIQEEKAKLRETFDPNAIDVNAGTNFYLGDAEGNLSLRGDLLDPAALRQLADALDQLYSGQIQTAGGVRFNVD